MGEIASNTLKSVKNPLFWPISVFFEKSQFFENPKSKSPNTPGHSPCCTPHYIDVSGGKATRKEYRRWLNDFFRVWTRTRIKKIWTRTRTRTRIFWPGLGLGLAYLGLGLGLAQIWASPTSLFEKKNLEIFSPISKGLHCGHFALLHASLRPSSSAGSLD